MALATAAIGRSKDSPGQSDLGAVIKESVKNAQKVRDSLDAADKLPVMMSCPGWENHGEPGNQVQTKS